MADYSVSGNFGQVRFFNTCVNSEQFASLSHISRFGWHKVNEQYHTRRAANSGCNHLLLFTVSGCGKVKVGKNVFIASPQTAVVIPSGVENSYCGMRGQDWEFYWLHYKGANTDAFTNDITRGERYVFNPDFKMLELVIERLKTVLWSVPLEKSKNLKHFQKSFICF